ncbi:MAG: TerC/Alx family metal homeostasis membrane protein [Spirochaetes bacterium]|nr:TerC/Alx family metal homeostasis membrane protein [Spirochaetota bacterium]
MNIELLFWISFIVVFIIVFFIDIMVNARNAHTIDVKTSLLWTGIWIATALVYGLAIYLWYPDGHAKAPLYIAGFLTEKSLSVDNLFVFIMIFTIMGVNPKHQPKIMKIGILLSILFRLVFILFGIALIERFHWILYVFGVLLLWTAYKMAFTDHDEEVHPEKNVLFRMASKIFPVDHDKETSKLFTKKNGILHVTSLFLVIILIGSTDVMFAIDSIPAIMGITRDPFIVITSNVFSLLGLVSLFFAIKGIMVFFRYLKHGVSFILFFIGVKMLAGIYHPIEVWFKDNSWVSLAVIGATLAVSIICSVIFKEKDETKDENAMKRD